MSEKHTKAEKSQRQADQREKRTDTRPEQTAKKHAPHLVSDGRLRRCSVCKQPFLPDAKPSVDEAFARHVSAHHTPEQTSEDVNQAAARIVREATEK